MVFKTLWLLLCASPVMILLSTMENVFSSKFFDPLIMFSYGAILLIVGVICAYAYTRAVQRYFLVPYLLVSNRSMKTWDIFVQSKEIMKAYAERTASMSFSFIKWLPLCLLVLPVMYIWPYYQQSRANTAKAIMDEEMLKMQQAQQYWENMRTQHSYLDRFNPQF